MSLEEDPSQNTTADGAGIVAAGNEHSHADPTNEQANVKREKRGAAGKSGDSDEGKPDQPRSKKPLIILVAVVVVFGITSFAVWFARRNQVSTDDAFTDGNVVTMVPKVSGYVVALYINDNSLVKEGDLVLRIDARDYLAVQAQARAQLDLAKVQLKAAQDALRIARVQYPAQLESARAQEQAAEATLALAESSYFRQHQVDRRATTEESVDASTSQRLTAAANAKAAKAQVAVARLVPEQLQQAADAVEERAAQVQQAEAQLQQANLNLGYTDVRSPSDGFVTQRNVQLGSYLTPGQVMFMIVTPEIWVTANFKESQIGRMQPGDGVDIEIDAYSGWKLHGHVQSIQYGTGSRFSAFPAENATGNFVKIVQRVPVKIVIDHGLDPSRPVPLGLSVSPVVHFP
jgi:membrane fusion protein, multidrug efflux system